MPTRASPDQSAFNLAAMLPYELRLKDFELALQDIYDFLYDVNGALVSRGLRRIEDMVRPAVFSGILSDTLAVSLARHSRALVPNTFHNGHPDLIPAGLYPRDWAQSGDEGVEVKVTRGSGGVDAHGARPGWMCVFRYMVDNTTEPAAERRPTMFTEVLLAELETPDFRRNDRGALGTRTASPNKDGLRKLRGNWIYRLSNP